MKNIEEIKNQTYALIDDLKKTTTENGLAGSGNEYVVIVEIFLYKFLNDKFIYEAKKKIQNWLIPRISLQLLMPCRKMIMRRCAILCSTQSS